MAHFSHLFLRDVLFRLIQQEALHESLVVFLTADVAEKVDAGEATTDYADRHLTELELEDGSDGEEDPHDGHSVDSNPENCRVCLIGEALLLSHGFEIPCFFAVLVDFGPPAKANQDSDNGEHRHIRVSSLGRSDKADRMILTAQ